MNNKEIIIITVELSKVKRFFIMDMGIGTLSYYAIKLVTGNVVIEIIGSMIITEGLKRVIK